MRLEPTRPSTPTGDLQTERALYRAVAGRVVVPAGRSAVLARRTQVIDAEVARALGRGTPQIVLLGAGYDGRPLRFADGATRWFEVDRPATLADKQCRLAALAAASPDTGDPTGASAEPSSASTSVAVDTWTDDVGRALDRAGHHAAAPTLFVCEDLFDSLPLQTTAALCTALRSRAAPGSGLVATFDERPDAAAPVRTLRAGSGLLRQVAGRPHGHEFRPGDPEKLMVVSGWRVTHAEATSGARLDPGAHVRLLVCEPAGSAGSG